MDEGNVVKAAARLGAKVSSRYGIEFGLWAIQGELLSAAAPAIGRVDTVPFSSVVHDDRGAPYVPADCCLGDERFRVSLADESGMTVFAWADVPANSAVQGVGVDLVCSSYFSGVEGGRLERLLMSEKERAIAHCLYPGQNGVAAAYAFGAKEAAFKSLSYPLRQWYACGGDELRFEAREFELQSEGRIAGTLRHARAQKAMDAMDIASIDLDWEVAGDAVVVLAVSKARNASAA